MPPYTLFQIGAPDFEPLALLGQIVVAIVMLGADVRQCVILNAIPNVFRNSDLAHVCLDGSTQILCCELLTAGSFAKLLNRMRQRGFVHRTLRVEIIGK